MSESGKGRESTSESGKPEVRTARQARLAAAMRENLKRRKAQARGRGGSTPKSARADKHPGD